MFTLSLQRCRGELSPFPLVLYLSSPPLSISTSPFFLHLPLFHTLTSLSLCSMRLSSSRSPHVVFSKCLLSACNINELGMMKTALKYCAWPSSLVFSFSRTHAWQNCNRLSCVVENLLTLQQKIYK